MKKEIHTKVYEKDVKKNNITKLDKTNYEKNGTPLASEYSDALAGLRGFATSDGVSSVIFSAGMNMRLYSYLEQFSAFQFGENGFKKMIAIKVSDYRSAAVQGKILA